MRLPTNQTDQHGRRGSHAGHGAHGAHGLMMIACCIPMLVIAIVLVATGVAGPRFIFVAIMCTAMMAMMMKMMDGNEDKQ